MLLDLRHLVQQSVKMKQKKLNAMLSVSVFISLQTHIKEQAAEQSAVNPVKNKFNKKYYILLKKTA